MNTEELAVILAEKCGDFELRFDATENRAAPDSMPWVLEFTVKGERQHFGWMLASPLDELLAWAIDFADGKVDANGLPVR